METNDKKYNLEWYKKRAFDSLKKLPNGTWDFSDSLLIYIGSGDELYEQLQEADTSYFKLVTKPEHDYLQIISKDIAGILPDNFEYIDLGPGTEHKEQFLFEELKKQGKTFSYIPVDISDHFLDMAEVHASLQGIAVNKLKASFEELPEILGKPTVPRFVSLGLTFSNYNPQEVFKLLTEIAGANGFVFINAQIRDRVDMVELQKVYQEDAVRLVDDKVRLIGLDPFTDISPRIADDGFRVWCSVINSNPDLEKIGIKLGDKLVVFQSLRYTKELLELELVKFNHQLLDTGSSFIGCVIKT